MELPLTDASAADLIGTEGTASCVVADGDTAIAAGSGDLDVLATPRMIALMEQAACTALAAVLPDGWTTVGTHVDVRHVKPTTRGATVIATARLTQANRLRFTFDVTAEVDGTTVGVGTHDRVAVERATFLAPS